MVKAAVVELLSRVHSRVSTTSVKSKPGGVYISIMLVRKYGDPGAFYGSCSGNIYTPFFGDGEGGGDMPMLTRFLIIRKMIWERTTNQPSS